jgi:hypothetical protein
MFENHGEKVTSFIEESNLNIDRLLSAPRFIDIVNNEKVLSEAIYTKIGDPDKEPNPDYFGFIQYQRHINPNLEQLTLYTLSYNKSEVPKNLKPYFYDVYTILSKLPSDIVLNVVNKDMGRMPNMLELRKLINTDIVTRWFIGRINETYGGIALNPTSKFFLDTTITAWNLWNLSTNKKTIIKLSTIAMDSIPDAQQKLYKLNIDRLQSLNDEQL